MDKPFNFRMGWPLGNVCVCVVYFPDKSLCLQPCFFGRKQGRPARDSFYAGGRRWEVLKSNVICSGLNV